MFGTACKYHAHREAGFVCAYFYFGRIKIENYVGTRLFRMLAGKPFPTGARIEWNSIYLGEG